MKIRIERLEIEIPDLIKSYFERDLQEGQAFEANKRVAIEIIGHMVSKLVSHLRGEPSLTEPPDSSADDPPQEPE